ncbi:MAG: ABC transporter substrate-binding protein [Actinomycetota bacterium]|nr:ABC transporter substrate-binding protein [Actinomycetota bacterium]
MNRRRAARGTFSVVLLCLLAMLAGCASTQRSSSGSPVPDGRLTVALEFGPKAGFAIDTDDAFVLTELGVVETLVRADPNGQGLPGLANSWQRIDPRTWRFQLRPGVSFHDGTLLTPEAVVTALHYVSSVAAPPRAIKGVGLQAASDGTDGVRISTTNPDPILPLRLSSPNTAILAPSAYRSTGPPGPIRTGTGPFVLTDVQAAQSATLVRWECYWGPRAALASAQARFIPDPMARATALRAGDVDLAQGIPDTALPELTSVPQIKVVTYPLPRTVSLYTNLTSPVLADRRIREAIEKAIDRPALATQVLNGSATAASDVFGGGVPWGDYTCAGYYNLNRYCSPAFDTIVGSLSQTADPVQRQETFRSAAKQLNQDIVGVPLVHSQARVGMRDVTGFVPDPQEHYLLTPQLARTG